jgi:ATP-dependent Clp protease ATP-binding subunit ClpX
MIPEFAGRIPVRAHLLELSEEELVAVQTEPKNAIAKQFIKMFGLEKIELEFTEDCLHTIARMCKKDKTGARGLRGIYEHKLLNLQYDLPELNEKGVTKIAINRDFILNDADPLMVYSEPVENQAN